MPDTDKYDKILNPKGTFEKPSLEQLREHKNKYLGKPKLAKKVSPRDKKAPGPNIA